MKKLLLLSVISFLFFSLSVFGQSIVPNSALRGQTLQTTITLTAGTMFNSSPPMGYQDIYLQQGGTIIFANSSYSSTLDWYNAWDPWTMMYVYTDSGRPTFDIPANAPNGYYDVVVITYPSPWGSPSTNTLSSAFFIGSPAGTISGSVYFDYNQNGMRDVNEPPLLNAIVQISPTNVLAYTNTLGEFSFYGDTGSYVTSYLPASGYSQTSTPLTYSATIPPSVSGQEFGTFSTQVNYSHAAYINRGRARCETTNPLIITIGNYGVLPVQDRITLITSSNYIYSSSSVAPDLTNGDTLSWYGPVLNPMTSYSLGGALMFTAPAAMQNVTIQVIDSMFDLSGTFIDVYLDTYTYQVRCSYDPNDKHVSPAGVLAQHYTPINSELTYLINFQNTGNDTAYDVFIHDTLDSDLDLSTFEVLGSSHEVNVQRTTAGAVRFNFFNIMLPDSGADEPGSHGWVLYRISPNAGLADPTEITNTSYIVFDQNIPVITNTTLNTMTALQYPQANFTTADVTICETDCILFSNQSVSGTSYQWNFQGGSPASSTSASPGAICYNASGTYDVTLVTTNALGSDTLTQSAYINVAPAPGVFSVVQAGDSLIAPQGYYSYQWYYDNILINGSTSYFYIATLDGDYGIVVGNANGCQSGVNIPNVIIGVDDITSGKAISVYPNPTSGKFELSFTSNDNQSVTITVFDKVGKVVQSKVVQTVSGVNKIAMDEQNLAAGVYTIQLAGKSKVISKLLMINK